MMADWHQRLGASSAHTVDKEDVIHRVLHSTGRRVAVAELDLSVIMPLSLTSRLPADALMRARNGIKTSNHHIGSTQ